MYIILEVYLAGNMGKVLPEYLSKWSTEKVKKGGCETFQCRGVTPLGRGRTSPLSVEKAMLFTCLFFILFYCTHLLYAQILAMATYTIAGGALIRNMACEVILSCFSVHLRILLDTC